MRATVMESNNGRSVVLTEDGVFRTINGSYAVGSEISYAVPVRERKVTTRIAAAAACLLMMLSAGTFSYQNLLVYATVTLSGAAPIQLQLNRHDKVIGVKGMDESGEALAEELLDSGIRGERFEAAVARAEEMIAKHDGDKQTKPTKPQVQCKSADKVKALKDILKKDKKDPAVKAGSGGEATKENAAGNGDAVSGDKITSDKTGETTVTEHSTVVQPSLAVEEEPTAGAQEVTGQDTGTQGSDEGMQTQDPEGNLNAESAGEAATGSETGTDPAAAGPAESMEPMSTAGGAVNAEE